MKYIIGIDVGTSGTKGVLFNTDGKEIASHLEEYQMLQPQNGWAQENPEDWWQACKTVLCELSSKAEGGEIAGIGLSGQMHSLVMLDENNNVIRPAILWCDQRTNEECREIESIIGKEKLAAITGNKAIPALTASKILWVRKHEPENYRKCRHILLAKDYIRFKLTGEYATEVSDASGMQLLDINTRNWSDEVCKALDINMSMLAKVYESPDVTGYVTKHASELCGIKEGVPVAGGGGDNACAAVGSGVYSVGKAFTTLGTSGVIFAPTSKPTVDAEGRFNAFCAAVPGTWHVLAITQAAGLSLNWFRNNIAKEYSYKEIDAECEKLAIGSEKLIYLPYLMGERTPILDSAARGVFFGLSAMHTKMHMARSVIEGVTFALYNCLDVLRDYGIEMNSMILCGGGGKSKFWQKVISNVYNMDISTLENDESAALGAAILGGVAGGVYGSVTEGCEKCVKEKNKTLPDITAHNEYMKYYKVYKNLYPALKDSFNLLSGI